MLSYARECSITRASFSCFFLRAWLSAGPECVGCRCGTPIDLQRMRGSALCAWRQWSGQSGVGCFLKMTENPIIDCGWRCNVHVSHSFGVCGKLVSALHWIQYAGRHLSASLSFARTPITRSSHFSFFVHFLRTRPSLPCARRARLNIGPRSCIQRHSPHVHPPSPVYSPHPHAVECTGHRGGCWKEGRGAARRQTHGR